MKKWTLVFILALSCVVVLFASGCRMLPSRVGTPEAGDGYTKIILLHTNDQHFDFNFLDEFESVVAEYRAKYDHVFLLDAGDIFVRHARHWPGNSLDFYEERSRFMMQTMNALAYDAAVLGNHELDYKGTITRDNLRLAEFPLLGANVTVTTDHFDMPEPYTILTTDAGHTIALLGLSTGGAEGITTGDYVSTVRDYLHLREENHVFVLLTHIGARNDRSLARQFGEIDVIIGGHSHTHINPAETVNGVLVAQTGGHRHPVDPERDQRLGVVRILLDNGKVIGKSGEVLTMSSVSERVDVKRPCGTAEVAVTGLREVAVSIGSYLSLAPMEVDISLLIDGKKIKNTRASVAPGGKTTEVLLVPVAMKGDHEIKVLLEWQEPDGLPEWERRMDFGATELSASFDFDDCWKVPALAFDVDVNGDLSEWRDVAYISIKPETDDEGKDIRAVFRAGWCDANLYLAFSVDDQKHFNTRQGSALWDGDSVQFAIDPGPDVEPFNLGVALASGEARSHQWMGPRSGVFEHGEYAVVRDEARKKTFYELRLPFEALKIEPGRGRIFTFNAVVFDDDDGEGQDYWIQIAPGIAGGWNTESFVRFVLW